MKDVITKRKMKEKHQGARGKNHLAHPEQPFVKPFSRICLNPFPYIEGDPFDLRSCRDRPACRLPLILDRSRRDFPMANEISSAPELLAPSRARRPIHSSTP